MDTYDVERVEYLRNKIDEIENEALESISHLTKPLVDELVAIDQIDALGDPEHNKLWDTIRSQAKEIEKLREELNAHKAAYVQRYRLTKQLREHQEEVSHLHNKLEEEKIFSSAASKILRKKVVELRGDLDVSERAQRIPPSARRWILDDGRRLVLLTPEEWDALPDGTKVVSILGEEKVKGEHEIDGDTRGGLLAYGVVELSYATAGEAPYWRTLFRKTKETESAKQVDLSQNCFTPGIYHGKDTWTFKTPFDQLYLTDEMLIETMIMRAYKDKRELYEAGKDREDYQEAVIDHSMKVTDNYKHLQEVLDYCRKDVEKVKEYQMEFDSTKEEYGDLHKDPEAWKRWRADHCYDSDTLNHVVRVWVNNYIGQGF